MRAKAARSALIVLGLLGAMTASADDAKSSSSSFSQGQDLRHRDGAGGDHDRDHRHVSGAHEPSKWLFLGVGLALVAVVAHRRQTRLQGR
jgi:hypothetical protein